MSKYKERGPYHFSEYADKNSPYHAHVQDLVDKLGTIYEQWDRGSTALKQFHEVGCGEGLILYRMWHRIGGLISFSGNEADSVAVDFATALLPHWIHVFLDNDITQSKKFDADIVLFSDSLEHIENWREHIEWAKKRAQIIAIAVPSARDRHAINQFNASSFDNLFAFHWKEVYRKTRDYRHVSIWVKKSIT